MNQTNLFFTVQDKYTGQTYFITRQNFKGKYDLIYKQFQIHIKFNRFCPNRNKAFGDTATVV